MPVQCQCTNTILCHYHFLWLHAQPPPLHGVNMGTIHHHLSRSNTKHHWSVSPLSLPCYWYWWSITMKCIGTSAFPINSVINCFMVKMNILFSVVAEPHDVPPPLFSRMEIGLNLISCHNSLTITRSICEDMRSLIEFLVRNPLNTGIPPSMLV